MSVLSQLFRRHTPAGAPRTSQGGYDYWTIPLPRHRGGTRRLERILANGWDVVNVIPPNLFGSHSTYTFRRPRPTTERPHFREDCWCEAGAHE
jgi:hypothetical protein